MKKTYMHDSFIKSMAANILHGNYKEGEQLPKEHELCQKYELSRTSVREGLHSLRNMGLVTTIPKAGTFVSSKDSWHILDERLLQVASAENIRLFKMDEVEAFRRLIEPSIVVVAAQNSNFNDIHLLEKTVNHMMENCDDENISEYKKADLEFHSLIIHATHNNIFRQLEPILKTIINGAVEITASLETAEGRYESALQHLKLVDAIRKKDTELARYLMIHMIFSSSSEAIMLEKKVPAA